MTAATMQSPGLVSTPPPSLSSSRCSSLPSDISMDSARKPNPLYRLPESFKQLSVDSPNLSPYALDDGASPSHSDSSPRTAPLSIRNLSHHNEDTASLSPSGLKHMGYPVLTIRKTSNVTAGSVGSFSQLSSLPRHHRRTGTESTICPELVKSSSPTIDCCHSFGDIQQCGEEPECNCLHDPHQVGETASPCEGGDEVCTRHHHRQSASSTFSIACSDRDDAVGSSTGFEIDDIFDEASIVMEPLAPSMLIPLVDRSEEMLDLLKHPANIPWLRLVRNAVGSDLYEKEYLKLWIRTDRKQMSDLEWLRKSKQLLSNPDCGGISDGRFWNEFCGMVGWDAGDSISLDEPNYSRRRPSCDSFMCSIVEELEEEEHDEEHDEEHGAENVEAPSVPV